MTDNNKILMCYGKTKFTPGRFLEDGFRGIGWHVDQVSDEIDFGRIDPAEYAAVLFVESPSKPNVRVNNIELVKIPKLFWVHHGETRLETNVALARKYRPDLVLMAHSLHLAGKFPAPVRFFPFGMAADIFNSSEPLKGRSVDISFIGNTSPEDLYKKRREALRALKEKFGASRRLDFRASVYLDSLAKAYRSAKIVINHSADYVKSLNMRIFEGMGCGALVITDFVPGMEMLFEDRKHLVLFHSQEELLERVDYYLNHPDEAQRIAAAGHRLLLGRHTYEHRAREIVELVRHHGAARTTQETVP